MTGHVEIFVDIDAPLDSPIGDAKLVGAVEYHDRLYVVWRKAGYDNGKYVLTTLADGDLWWAAWDGQVWTPTRKIEGTGSRYGVSLCVAADQLVMAWRGAELNDDSMFITTFDLGDWNPQRRLADYRSSFTPRLAAVNGGNNVLATWVGEGNHGMYYAISGYRDPFSWEAPRRIAGSDSWYGPSLVTLGDTVFAAWRGLYDPDGGDQGLYMSTFTMNGGWQPQQKMDNKGSKYGPTLVTHRGLVLAFWSGVDTWTWDTALQDAKQTLYEGLAGAWGLYDALRELSGVIKEQMEEADEALSSDPNHDQCVYYSAFEQDFRWNQQQPLDLAMSRGFAVPVVFRGELYLISGSGHAGISSDGEGLSNFAKLDVILSGAGGSYLFYDSSLKPGEQLVSPRGVHRMCYQTDGNLVIYRQSDGQPIWASNTWEGAYELRFGVNGKAAIYPQQGGSAAWETPVYGSECGCRLMLRDDGNLVVYDRLLKEILCATDNAETSLGVPLIPGHKASSGQAPVPAPGPAPAPGPSPSPAFPAGAAPATDRPAVMHVGQYLLPDQYLQSSDGRNTLHYQGDGNLVLYGPNAAVLWKTDTYLRPAHCLYLGGDGNLVVYGAPDSALWQSVEHNGQRGAQSAGGALRVQNDGNLEVRAGDGTLLWSSGSGDPPTAAAPPLTVQQQALLAAQQEAERQALLAVQREVERQAQLVAQQEAEHQALLAAQQEERRLAQLVGQIQAQADAQWAAAQRARRTGRPPRPRRRSARPTWPARCLRASTVRCRCSAGM